MCASRLGRRWWPRWSAPPKPVRSPNTPHQHNPPRCFARAAVPTLSSGGGWTRGGRRGVRRGGQVAAGPAVPPVLRGGLRQGAGGPGRRSRRARGALTGRRPIRCWWMRMPSRAGIGSVLETAAVRHRYSSTSLSHRRWVMINPSTVVIVYYSA